MTQSAACLPTLPIRRTLRIVHVLTSTQRRGAESFAVTLRSRLLGRGHDARVAALVRATHPPELDVDVLGRRTLSPPTLARLRRFAADADVVIAHGSRTLPATVLALANTPVPIVYVNIGDPAFWADSRWRRRRVRFLLGQVRAVAARTDVSRAALVRHFGLRPQDVTVIGNGRASADFPPADDASRGAARCRLGLPPDGDLVVCLGALSWEKRVDVAIDAVAQLRDVHLVVAGDGPLRAALEARARDALGSRVSFLGVRDDIATVLTACDVLALPSDSEGLPGVVIEAGMVGLPVVATDVGFVSFTIIPGRTGLLVPRSEPDRMAVALRLALSERVAMGAAGREHCLANFELDRVVDDWECLLLRVARARGTP